MGPIPSASTIARMESLDMVIADPFNSKSKTTPQVGAARRNAGTSLQAVFDPRVISRARGGNSATSVGHETTVLDRRFQVLFN